MRPPPFWDAPPDRPGWPARLLSPLARVYARATAARVARPGMHPGVPVISVGNLTAGGAGKTPTVIALLDRLAARGVAAHVVSRGYGGRLAGPVRVAADMSAADVGDEPLLLSAFAPAWVARDRPAGVRAAAAAGAGAIVLDDAHQTAGLMRDLSIVVVDAAQGFGNGRVIPAGPLREPVPAGLARADLVLAIGDEAAQDRLRATWGRALGALPVLTGRMEPLPTGMDWAGQRVVAFAGIARPEKLFATLRALGADLCATHALDDHQPLSDALVARLLREARSMDAQLVTTEKDAARLPAAWRSDVVALPVRLRLDHAGALDMALDRLFARGGA
ncbi:MAG: tetraacyldisaccharide 4'-kinase [Rhodobacteraceae bacterium]|jgi:tetraacyldisaccharide 4'-kinase|nr:tetraacyldisaccharide 4'-kinase [Paracoccaceae bacterium]